jgi:hypothetical protein
MRMRATKDEPTCPGGFDNESTQRRERGREKALEMNPLERRRLIAAHEKWLEPIEEEARVGTVNRRHYLNARTHESVINVIFVSFLWQEVEKNVAKEEAFPFMLLAPVRPIWVHKCLLLLVFSVFFLLW